MRSKWKDRVVRRFDRGAHTYDDYSNIQVKIAQSLAQDLPELKAARILEIGCGTGVFTQHLFAQYPNAQFVVSDVSPQMLKQARMKCDDASVDVEWRVMDGEMLDQDMENFDLIVSNMSVQWFVNIGAGLEKLKKILRPGGRVLFSMPGGYMFYEWRKSTGGLEKLGVLPNMVSCGVFREEKHIVHYKDADDFLQHLKKTGAQSTRDFKPVMTPKQLKDACKNFDMVYNAQVTWHVLYVCIYAEDIDANIV